MHATPALRLRALWLALGWALAMGIVWLSLTPSPPKIELEQGDKLGHLASYGALMFWFCQLYAGRGARLAYAVGFTLMGVALEFAQGALGTRSFEPADMLANAAGVALGWLLAEGGRGSLFARIEGALSARLRG
jgi:VanZ family protein